VEIAGRKDPGEKKKEMSLSILEFMIYVKKTKPLRIQNGLKLMEEVKDHMQFVG